MSVAQVIAELIVHAILRKILEGRSSSAFSRNKTRKDLSIKTSLYCASNPECQLMWVRLPAGALPLVFTQRMKRNDAFMTDLVLPPREALIWYT